MTFKPKDFAGAQKIIDYFEEKKLNPRRVAMVFGKHGDVAHMMGLFANDFWTNEAITMWKRAIKAYEKHAKMVESRATESTGYTKKEPVKAMLKVKTRVKKRKKRGAKRK
jgi:D-mannonate dehydratase